jgi:hypothetical protein
LEAEEEQARLEAEEEQERLEAEEEQARRLQAEEQRAKQKLGHASSPTTTFRAAGPLANEQVDEDVVPQHRVLPQARSAASVYGFEEGPILPPEGDLDQPAITTAAQLTAAAAAAAPQNGHTLTMEGTLVRKVEYDAGGKRAPFRSWKPVHVICRQNTLALQTAGSAPAVQAQEDRAGGGA